MDIEKPEIIVFAGLGELFFDNYQHILRVIGQKPDYLFDNDHNKWGAIYHGKKCLNKKELLSLPGNTKIIIVTRLVDIIFCELKKFGFRNIYAVNFERSESRVGKVYEVAEAKKFRQQEIQLDKKQLEGTWCYISGASRGIGAFIAQTMAKFGVNLVLQARTIDGLRALKEKVCEHGIETIECSVEFENSVDLDNHCTWLKSNCPTLDFGFLNAGMSLKPEVAGFSRGNPDGWARTYQVNLIAPWKITNTFLMNSKLKKRGKLLYVSSSISGRLDESGYACSKAALNKLIGDLSKNSKSFEVDFCLLDPGWISTDMGGHNATNNISSLFPGVVLPIISPHSCNGSWISIQDYCGFSVEEALNRAYYLGNFRKVV